MRIYAWIENEQLFMTEDKNLAPSNAIELEVESIDDVILDNGQIRLKTEAERLAEEKQKKLSELKKYVAILLAQTDYIITKIAEAQIQNNTVEIEVLKQKYATQLQQREMIRVWNEQLKQAIKNATSLEELRNIIIEFKG